MGFTILIILGCVVGGVVIWHLIGFGAINRDPIGFGVYYIKTSMRERTPINPGLIPDDAFREFAKAAYRHAEFMHKAVRTERRPIMSIFHDNLDMHVIQISNVMSGTVNEWEKDVAKVLEQYGVRIPNQPTKR